MPKSIMERVSDLETKSNVAETKLASLEAVLQNQNTQIQTLTQNLNSALLQILQNLSAPATPPEA